MRNLWWTLPAAGLTVLMVGVLGNRLSGQAVQIVPQPRASVVQLLVPEFEAASSAEYHTPVMPVGHIANPAVETVTAQHDQLRPVPECLNGPQSQEMAENVQPRYPTPETYVPTIPADPEYAPYLGRVQEMQDESILPISLPPLPPDFTPWWMRHIAQPLRADSQPLPVTVEWLSFRALDHSPQVLAMNLDPSIRQTEILEQQASFDWQAFVDSAFNANSDPVGNTLTTGGSPRFRDRIFGHTMGFRKKNTYGAEIEASQKIGYQDNNSQFFVPTQQGTSILTLSFTQPLLARSGRIYNTSRIAMAYLDSGIAADELTKGLQDHLVQVAEAYWELYRARATLQQKQKLLARAEYVLELLEARKDVDAQVRQILRARAAVASRRSEITRAAMSIRNAESRLRFLVNDPEMIQSGAIELLPSEAPLPLPLNVSMGDSLVTAIQNRPEIAKALKAVRNKGLELGMAESEFKPSLDFVVGTYVSGLQGQSDIAQSFLNQFNQGEPGWSVGFLFDMPLGRRAARARLNRQQLEMQQAMLDFRTSMEMTLSEVEISVRELRTTYQEMLSTFQAMQATETEAQFLYERWRLLVGSDQSTTLLLEDLLDAQERVADEEANFVTAQVVYVLALANLKRTMGVLLMMDSNTAFTSSPSESQAPPQESVPLSTPVQAPEPSAIPKPALPSQRPMAQELHIPQADDLPPLPVPVGPGHSQSPRKELPSPGHSKPKPPNNSGPTLRPPAPNP